MSDPLQLVKEHMDMGKANALGAGGQVVEPTGGLNFLEFESYQGVSGIIGAPGGAPCRLSRPFRTEKLKIDLHIRARGFDSNLNCPTVEADMNGVDVDQSERVGLRYLISRTGISEGLEGEEYR